MAWRQSDAVSERVRFIAAWLSREESVSALATRFGVSRKTANKWTGRYAAEGPAGLAERSSAPLTHPPTGCNTRPCSREVAPEALRPGRTHHLS
jgi:transposase-like protein